MMGEEIEELRTTRESLAAALDEIDNLRAEIDRLRAEIAARATWRRIRTAHLVASEGDPAVRAARLSGYEGDPCPHCGERRLVRSGAQYACDGCGKRWEEEIARREGSGGGG